MSIKRARLIVQSVVFLGMFIIPFLNRLEIYFIKGTFISLDVGSLGIADPVMIFQAILSSTTAAGVLLTSALIPLLIMLFLGRVWCGWGCPYTFILDLLEKIPAVRRRMMRLKKSSNGVFSTTLKRFFIFIGFFTLVGIAGVPILHLFSPPAVLSSEALVLVKSFALTGEVLFIVCLLAAEIFFSYRFACRFLCPTGTCLSFFKSPMGLRVDYTGSCPKCGACKRACPMCLDPTEDAANRLCYNCGKCVELCPDKEKPLKWRAG